MKPHKVFIHLIYLISIFSLQSPVRHHSVCTFNDDIFLVGGFSRHRVISAAVIKYHVKSSKSQLSFILIYLALLYLSI